MAAWWRPAAWIGAALVVLSGCTYDAREPGLFPSPPPTTESPVGPHGRFLPQPTNPRLPVAGERVFVSAFGQLPITFRFAVHAVRRVQGATVLDWSITPVSAPGFGFGDSLPSTELGLDPNRREAAGLLVDPVGGRLYPPLTYRSRAQFNHCLCTPLIRLQPDLQVGETRLLQTTFPALPAALTFVDVSLLTVAPIRHVPVSPIGTAPVALAPTDLARPAEVVPPVRGHLDFANPSGSKQVQRIEVRRVLAAPAQATLEWTLTSVTDQPSRVLDYQPPVESPTPDGVEVAVGSAASGPVLRAGSTRLTNLWSRTTVNRRPAYDCLCTEIAEWAAGLHDARGTVGLVTNYPGLPAGTRTVDVEFPGFATFRGVPVVAAEDGARRLSDPVPAPTRQWTYDLENVPYGWPTSEWPTDTPDTSDLANYDARVEPLATLPSAR